MWAWGLNACGSVWKYVLFEGGFFLVVMGSPATRSSSRGDLFGQKFNQSRNRGWGKEGEGGE